MHRGLITHLEGAIINAEIRLIRTIINYTEASEHARPSVSSGINRFCYAWFQRGDIRNRDTISYFRVIFTPTASHVFSPISRSPCLSTLSNLFFAVENWGLLFFFFLLIKFSKIKFSIIDKNFDCVRRIFWKLQGKEKRFITILKVEIIFCTNNSSPRPFLLLGHRKYDIMGDRVNSN